MDATLIYKGYNFGQAIKVEEFLRHEIVNWQCKERKLVFCSIVIKSYMERRLLTPGYDAPHKNQHPSDRKKVKKQINFLDSIAKEHQLSRIEYIRKILNDKRDEMLDNPKNKTYKDQVDQNIPNQPSSGSLSTSASSSSGAARNFSRRLTACPYRRTSKSDAFPKTPSSVSRTELVQASFTPTDETNNEIRRLNCMAPNREPVPIAANQQPLKNDVINNTMLQYRTAVGVRPAVSSSISRQLAANFVSGIYQNDLTNQQQPQILDSTLTSSLVPMPTPVLLNTPSASESFNHQLNSLPASGSFRYVLILIVNSAIKSLGSTSFNAVCLLFINVNTSPFFACTVQYSISLTSTAEVLTCRPFAPLEKFLHIAY